MGCAVRAAKEALIDFTFCFATVGGRGEGPIGFECITFMTGLPTLGERDGETVDVSLVQLKLPSAIYPFVGLCAW